MSSSTLFSRAVSLIRRFGRFVEAEVQGKGESTVRERDDVTLCVDQSRLAVCIDQSRLAVCIGQSRVQSHLFLYLGRADGQCDCARKKNPGIVSNHNDSI